MIHQFQALTLILYAVCLIGCSSAYSKKSKGSGMLRQGSVSIAQWKNDAKAAFTFTADDGNIRSIKSQWTPEKPNVPYDGYFTLGKTYGIPMTFFIMPKYIITDSATEWDTVMKQTEGRFSISAWADWKFMHDNGHEIASHTFSHADFRPDSLWGPNEKRPRPKSTHYDEECVRAIEAITKNIGEPPVSFKFPYGEAEDTAIAVAQKYHPLLTVNLHDDIIGAGHGAGTVPESLFAKLSMALQDNKWLVLGGHGLRTELGKQELEQYTADPEKFIAQGHQQYDGYKPVAYEVLEALFRKVHENRGDLFIDQFKNVGRYAGERNCSTITILEDTPQRLIFTVSHSLGDVFDYPLTIKLALRQNRVLEVEQNGKNIPVQEKGGDFLFDVVPNAGHIIVMR